MRIIQTLWTRPRGGRFTREDALRWSLSSFLARKHHGRVELFTDREGKRLLVDELRLPYDEVHVCLDGIPDSVSLQLWSYGKVRAYWVAASQGEPFIHIDDDVFLFRPLRQEILEAPLAAQSIEALCYYRASLQRLQGSEAEEVPSPKRWRSYNLGVFGGTDLEFISRYAERSMAFAERLSARPGATHHLNIVSEQAVFGKCVLEAGRSVACVLAGGLNDREAERLGYCHVMLRKAHPGTHDRVEKALARETGIALSKAPAPAAKPLLDQLPSARKVRGFDFPGRANYNGGLLRWGGRNLLFYRSHRAILDGRHDLSLSSVYVADFDRAAASVSSGRKLEITVPDYPHVEDPRPVILRGRPHLAVTVARYTDRCYCQQALFRLGDDLRVEAEVPLPARTKFEKNWQFFDHGGRILCVYDPAGHLVLDIETGEEHRSSPVSWLYGRPAGGTPPVRVGDWYYSYFHSHTADPEHGRRYHFGLYRFEARPPFRAELVSRTPICSATDSEGRIGIERRMHWHPLVVFPGSAEFHDGVWTVVFGVNDSFQFVADIPHPE